MGIDEICQTIYPYMVGREDCKVLPRSFKTLAEGDSTCTTTPVEPQVTSGAWTREIEKLCRALEAQQKVRSPNIDAEEK